ncbi:MAG: THUMP domain-containing protein [Gemmataceae bacterium]|nr:THUMP domain-containing protein [Gemmataceae bacterium]MDW8266923.1 THUMP domain-containing protein [Gemmataceae bacterium]
MRLFATCARGLEPVLADELRALGADQIEPGRGGVAFAGDQALLYQSNLWLRTAIRVLRPILQATVHSADELYDAVQTVDWSRYLTPEHTLAVDCNVRDSALTHSHYAALKTKDAICDWCVRRWGRRPNVDVRTPLIALNLHIERNHAVLSLDSSGESLHKRGYRPILTKAPLNEALAAGLLMLAGYDGRKPLIDPMCGSGTLPIEAAWLALRRPPGLTRKRFGFQAWLDFDVGLWTAMRDEARRGVGRRLPAPIAGSDRRRDAVAFARANARAAGVGHLVTFTQRDVRLLVPPAGPPGVLICNPPYGERIGTDEELRVLYGALGEVLRRFAGWSVWLFTGNAALAAEIGLEPVRSIALFNGAIRCRLLGFEP